MDDPLEQVGQVRLPHVTSGLCRFTYRPPLHTVLQAVLARFGPARMDEAHAAMLSALENQKSVEHAQAAARRQVIRQSCQRV